MPAPASSPSLAELLVSVPPRERSGSRSSNRFSFQHSWALGLVLRLHEKPDDYCILFDVHEDVVALDSSSDPTGASVYQVKTDTTGGAWTAHKLTKRERNKDTGTEKPSILGKLYSNYMQFPGCVKSMSFVTNATFSLKLAKPPPCSERESFCIADVADDEQTDINSKIANEHSVSDPPAGLSRTFMVRTSLSVEDHERHTEGIVSDFLKTQADGTIPPAPFHRTLQSELRRRNDRETMATTFAELAKQRGLSRGEMQRMIDSVPTDRRMTELLSVIRLQLVQEALNIRQQGLLNAEVAKYLAQRLDQTNTLLSDARKKIMEEVTALPETMFTSAAPIANVISELSAVEADEFKAIRNMYSETFLHAMIAVAIYEQHEFPAPGPQPTEEGT